jgi:hypothetical protein
MSKQGYDNDFSLDDKHPQFSLIKRHIERAVQDLFLDSLRNDADNLVHIFLNEQQIEEFIERILKYWEELEDYEICKEVISLSAVFKERWKERDQIPQSEGLMRLKNLFDTNS